MSRCMCNKDKISYMKKNTFSNLPKNCINAHMSRTLCVQVETTNRVDPQHVCCGSPGAHSLRTAVLDCLFVLERYCFK